jgi:endonuclease YncB( thermonuclease family)
VRTTLQLVRAARRVLTATGRSLLALFVIYGPGIALAQTSAPRSAAPPSGAGPLEARGYIRAIDGDTMDTRIGQLRVGVGIIGIRAPAGNTPCGRQATQYLQQLVSGDGVVQLVEEPGLTLDARSRRLYHVTTGDGRSVAETMVGAGLARADGRGSNRDTLAELEAKARAEGRGCLWAAGGTP